MDTEWLTGYYRGLGYNERRIAQMLKKGEVIEKEKKAEVEGMKKDG
jgi:hypothetical protein